VDFDAKRAMGTALRTIRDTTSVERGMAELLAFCRAQAPEDDETWGELSGLDFGEDVRAIAAELAVLISALGDEYTGLYFGLDGLNMPHGKGIEFGCATGYVPGAADDEWVYGCSRYPGEIASGVLSEMYRHVRVGRFGDCVLCLGYLGMALRAALERVDAAVTLGGAGERAVVFGFHDGDLLRLGVIKPGGFELRYDDAATRWAAESASAAAGPVAQGPSPLEQADTSPPRVTRMDWIRRAGREARRSEDPAARARLWNDIVTAVALANEQADGEMFDEALAAAASAPDPHARVMLRCAAAEGMARAGRSAQIDEVLNAARRDAGGLPDMFRRSLLGWIEHSQRQAAFWASREWPATDPTAPVRFWADPKSPEGRAIALWEEGQHEAARDEIEQAIAEVDRAALASNNQHHQISAIGRLLDAQRAMGDVEGFRASAARVAEAVEGWALPGGWMSASVFSEVAEYLHAAGDARECRRCLAAALAAADEETSASLDSHGRVSAALQRCGQIDQALDVARRIRPASERRKLLIQLLTREGRTSEAEDVYRSVQSPTERVALALAAARA
jgi:hypothetical protein